MRESFSYRSRDSVIRPFAVRLAYESLFEAAPEPVRLARGDPALAGRRLSKSRDLSPLGLEASSTRAGVAARVRTFRPELLARPGVL